MKSIKCCGLYCCVYIPPDDSEYPKRKMKKDFNLKFDEVLQKQKLESFNKSLENMDIKVVKEEIKIIDIDNKE